MQEEKGFIKHKIKFRIIKYKIKNRLAGQGINCIQQRTNRGLQTQGDFKGNK